MASDSTRDHRGQPRNAAKASVRSRLRKSNPSMAAADDAGDAGSHRLVSADRHRPNAAACVGLKMATADLNGSVTVKSASLGWLSPIEVRDIEVKDKTGNKCSMWLG